MFQLRRFFKFRSTCGVPRPVFHGFIPPLRFGTALPPLQPGLRFFVHRAGRTARAGKTGLNIVIGDEYEMNQFARLEKKLGLKVYPKTLFKGKLVSPSELEKKGE